jgi:hypothetical protein
MANDQEDKDQNDKLGHAIEFLNHHVPFYGTKSIGSVEDEVWKGGSYMMDRVPTEVRTNLDRALSSAARYIAEAFAEADNGG